uniref:Sulfotransferase n=1 Tax=Branchiostoma floridae TaxID=7739 RepID=C3ZDB0_BRAFL|eukprot:XP_002593454.1 hypothetical protein BRAFLDRAFT_70766 [Branchiostoma floridae]
MALSQEHPLPEPPPYMEYQGILFPANNVKKETLEAMKTFEIRDDDVVIVSYPKSDLYGDYFDHVLGWWQMKDDPHFLFVKYEDMKKDFRSSVKTIAACLEKELTDEQLSSVMNSCSLESMRKTLAESDTFRKNIVRNGMVGDWKNHFSAEESARFDQKYRERMAGTGLEFDFQ